MRIHVNDLSQVLFTHLYGPAMFSTIYVSPQQKEMKLGFVMQWEISSNLQPFKVSLRLLQGKESTKQYFTLGLLISILLDKPEFFEFITEFSKNVGALYEHCLKHGFSSAWGQLIDSLDPLGERNALKVSDTYQ